MKTYIAVREWPKDAWHTDMVFSDEEIITGRVRAEVEYDETYYTLTGYRALAVEFVEYDDKHEENYPCKAVIYGVRRLLNPRQSGVALEGYVYINRKKFRAFTSELMVFEIGEAGSFVRRLVSVAILEIQREG